MDLPDLGTSDPNLRDQLGLGPEWGWDKGIIYNPEFARFKLNHKGLLANGEINDNINYQALLSPNGNSHLQLNGMVDPLKLQYEAMLRQNGDYALRGNMPLMKGLLSLEAERNDDNDSNRLRLQYQRNF